MQITELRFLKIYQRHSNQGIKMKQTPDDKIIVNLTEGAQLIYEYKRTLASLLFIEDNLKYEIQYPRQLNLIYEKNNTNNEGISELKNYVRNILRLREIS